MKVHCPECGAQIPADDLNIQTFMARCRACDSVFSFADAARAEARGTSCIPATELAAPLGRPARIHVDESAHLWKAWWRWFTPVAIFLVLFCVAWDSFLIVWYSMATKMTAASPFGWLFVIFPVGHVAVGVGLTYFTLTLFVNSTTIEATADQLTVRYGPLPWFGNRTLSTATITRLATKETVRNNQGSVNRSYALMATLSDGRSIKLIGMLKDSDEANYLQQELERRLRLRPSPLAA